MMAASAVGFWDSLWICLWVGPLLLACAALPLWPWSRKWGYVPSAGLLLLAAFVLLLHLNYII